MRRATDLQKVTLNLAMGDKDTLAAFYPQVGWSVAARRIIELHCNQLRASEPKRPEIEDIKVPPLE